LLVLFDGMAISSQMAWNMSAADDNCEHHHFKLENKKFHLILEEQVIQF